MSDSLEISLDDMIGSLLANIGARCIKHNACVTLVEIDSDELVYADAISIDKKISCCFSNVSTMLELIFNTIDGFWVKDERIENPYRGCKTIEEALIRHDLKIGDLNER